MAEIGELRQRPIGDLTASQRDALLGWLLDQGFQSEYQEKLAELRLLERRSSLKRAPESRALLNKPNTESEVTVHGTPIRLKVQTFDESTETSTQTSLSREASTVELGQPSESLQLPPTEQHHIGDSEADKTQEAKIDRKSTSPSALLESRKPLFDSMISPIDDSRATPAIVRPRYQPRRIQLEVDDTSLPEEPPPLPPQVFQQAQEQRGDSVQNRPNPISREKTALNTADYSTSSRIITAPGPRLTAQDRGSLRPWAWTTLLAIVSMLFFFMYQEHERLTSAHALKMDMVEDSFKGGNYSDIQHGLTVLESTETPFGFTGLLLDSFLPLFGGTGLKASFIGSELRSELKLRSALVFVFKDETAIVALENLIGEAAQRGIAEQDLTLAKALLSVSTRSLDPETSTSLGLTVIDGHSAWVQAVLNESMGKLEAAERNVRSAMSLNFEHPYAGLTLAGLLTRRGDRVGALKVLDQLLQTRPEFVLARILSARLGLYFPSRRRFAQEDLELLHSNRSLSATEKGLVGILLAEEEIRRGKLVAAEFRLSKILNGGAQQEDVVRRLADVYFKQSKLGEVEALLSKQFWLPDETKLELWAELFLLMGLPNESLERLQKLTVKTTKSEMLFDESLVLQLLMKKKVAGQLDNQSVAHARRRLEELKGHDRLEPSLVMIEALITPDRKRLLATARQQLKRSESAPMHRLISWRFVVAWGRLLDGEFTRGARLLSSGKNMRPLTGPELWLKCMIESKRLRLKSAKSACLASIKLSAFEPARSLLADLLEQRAEYTGVIEVLTQASKRTHMLQDDVFRLARALYLTGDEAALERLGAGKPGGTSEGGTLFAQGLNEVLEGNVEDGLSRLRRSATRRSEDTRLLTLVGSIFAQHKRPREAQKLFELAISINKEPFQRIGLARLLMDHGELEQGLEVARTAEKLAQSSICRSGVRAHAVALQARAHIRMKGRRNLTRARSLLKKAKRINRSEHSVLITAGLYFEKTGKKKKAKEQYRTLLELDENSLEAQYRLGRLLFAQKRTRREGRALLDGLSRAFTQTIWSDKARGLLP